MIEAYVFGVPCRNKDRQVEFITKPSKAMTQAKLTSLYGNKILRANNCSYKSSLDSINNSSKDCVIVEKGHSYHNFPKGHSVSTFSKVEEEERGHGNSLGTKRAHVEISGPRNDSARSPSSNEEADADVSGNGFVTAKAKLV